MIYLGHLPSNDPLYEYLRWEILPQVGANGTRPDFRVYRIQASNRVYLYQERRSRTQLVGKYFASPGQPADIARARMQREFSGLHHLRRIGFDGYPHYVVRPLGCNSDLSALVMMEYCHGVSLDNVIMAAIHGGARDRLFEKLTALGYFLSRLHNLSGRGGTIGFALECDYFEHLLNQLLSKGRIPWHQAQELRQLRERWRERPCMWEDQPVLVHGDMTPTNVLFGDGLWVIVMDLERMKATDRVFDLGRVAAELKHAFWLHAGDGRLAEPFIGHLLWEYACHFPDRQRAFAAICARLPFYMALTEMRIARNDWVSEHHRRRLLDEAANTLR